MPVRQLTIDSRLLADNPLGDPARRTLSVYVPPDYDTQTGRLPVVWFLAGYTGNGPSMLSWRSWDESTPERMDRLIGAGAIPPMLAAFPDCWTRWGGSQYLDSPATGRYQSHLVDELIPAVDAAFRTVPEALGRAITGVSSGGYGALMTGMQRPEAFGLVSSTAGDCAFDLSYRPDLPKAVVAWDRAGGVDAFVEAFFASRKKRGDQIGAMMVLAMAACYSPNLSAPPVLADLPVDLHTAEVVPEVWARWLACDPLAIAGNHVDALRSLHYLGLDAGRYDEYNLQFGQRLLSRRFAALGIEHTFEEFDDGHRGLSYRQEHTLKKLAAAWRTAGVL